ncbi:hypothetical protein WCD74_29245 [Actinomycetospora sp. OC33-EN08]|uniref:Uncharacterized protein n=1 Tax=Actinomycetospora aurantiaca TaxID=3129233 RepID=A0ABU8MX18_9PSEU
MSAHRSPTGLVADRRPTAGPVPSPRVVESLPTAVEAGLACLRNLALVEAVIEVANVEDRLRVALNVSRPDPRGGVAARIACAHLAAGNLTEAYFALLQAHEHMLGTSR